MAANVLITGLPRAGTTLTTELLGRLPDCVALDEPMDVGLIMQGAEHVSPGNRSVFSWRRSSPSRTVDRERTADNVVEFCRQSRMSALQDGTVITKHVDGGVTGAKVADELTPDGKRTRLARRGVINIDKPLKPDFTLFIKHNSAFTGMLSELKVRFEMFGIVRNPLAILASWNTVPFAVGTGHASLAERLNPDLKAELAGKSDVVDRQLYLLDWFFRRLATHLGKPRTLRYEDIVSSDGAALSVIHPAATQLEANLTSRNRATVYDVELMKTLGQRLLATDGSYWSYYDRADVLNLIPTQDGT
jgi:hypothetical protein